MFGRKPREIGGCLPGNGGTCLWHLEAAALHHEPPLGEHEELTPLAAVHIANVLERELWPDREEIQLLPFVNTPFLNELWIAAPYAVWRAAWQTAGLWTSWQKPRRLKRSDLHQALSPPRRRHEPGNHLPGPCRHDADQQLGSATEW